MKRWLLLQSTILAAGLIAGQAIAQTTPTTTAPKSPPANSDKATSVSEVVVTGVFSAKAIEKAPISVNVVTAKQLAQQSPVSAADLLKNIPGVFVNSSLGEIRNVVFSRGVSANSLDAAGGYYYVSLQEDGLPTDLITATNYGPDYFLRPDITLSRLEGLRGGTAVITGPNAPGGIFNYISKTGRSDPGIEISTKLGLEADGSSPYYRADAFVGGRVGDSNLYYSIGGFYRADNGSHPPGYLDNNGGQIKANLLWDYSSGSLLITGKYLDDHNDWVEFTPTNGGDKFSPGFSNTSSDLPPANSAHCYTRAIGGRSCWDPKNLVHSQSLAFGVNWKQDISSNIHFENLARYSHNQSKWNNGTVISAESITDPLFALYSGIGFLPGTLNFYNHNTGQLLATLASTGSSSGLSVITNNLPGQNVLKNGVYGFVADDQTFSSDEFVDQATLTADFGNHHLALGAYTGIARQTQFNNNAGLGLMTLTNRPTMINVTYTSPLGGPAFQVTDPAGFMAEGENIGDNYSGTQDQFSVFFGDSWKVIPRLTIDAGGRYEAIFYNIVNHTFTPSVSLTGGADGNPLTLYDNSISAIGPSYRLKRDYSFFNYSGSVAYEISDSLNAYVRYSMGQKAPDFGTIEGIALGGASTVFPKPQNIEQVELGIKYHHDSIDLQFFPFYSLLSNVTSPQLLTYLSGPQTGSFYSPPPVAGTIQTYGVEISATARLLPSLMAQADITLQNPQARHFASWVQGPKGDGTDDTLVTTPPGDADNNPKVMVRAGLTWTPIDAVSVFGQVTYMGARAANAADAFYLPAYTTVDMGASWQITPKIKAQLNVTNLFNENGVLSWSSAGFASVANRQGLLKGQFDPNGVYPIVPIQARAFFLTLSAKF